MLASSAALTSRRQLLLATYWFSLSFHAGALLGIAIPAQLTALSTTGQATTLLAVLGGFAGLVTMIAQPIAASSSRRTEGGRRTAPTGLARRR